MRVAILGLGEAGGIYAADLHERGVQLVGFDPVAPPPPGIAVGESIAAAVADAEVVLSLVGARAAAAVLDEAAPAMRADALFADLNTGSPDAKRSLAERALAAGIGFVDVAVLAPVPRARLATPLIVSGSGASALAERLRALDVPVEDAGPDAGDAASRKLLRSVFMKGLAALVFESLAAADAAGASDWTRRQIAGELGPDGDALVERLLTGTRQHALRREAEMRDAADYLAALGTPAWTTDASVRWLRRIAAEESSA